MCRDCRGCNMAGVEGGIILVLRGWTVGGGETILDEFELESEVTVTRDSKPLSSVSEWKLLGDILLR